MMKIFLTILLYLGLLPFCQTWANAEAIEIKDMLLKYTASQEIPARTSTGKQGKINIGTQIIIGDSYSCARGKLCRQVSTKNSDGSVNRFIVKQSDLFTSISKEVKGPLIMRDKETDQTVEITDTKKIVLLDFNSPTNMAEVVMVNEEGEVIDHHGDERDTSKPIYLIDLANFKNGTLKVMQAHLELMRKQKAQEGNCDDAKTLDKLITFNKKILNIVAKTGESEVYEPSCRVLKQLKSELKSNENKEKMLSCLKNLKSSLAKIMKNSKTPRKTLLTFIYSKLSNEERDFLAMVITAHGESRSLTPPKEEFTAVMKVLHERLLDTMERGQALVNSENQEEKTKGAKYLQAELMDMAIQNLQFSIYNTKGNQWLIFFREDDNKEDVAEDQVMLIDSYLQYDDPNTKYEPAAKKLTHYCTKELFDNETDTSQWYITGASKKISTNKHNLKIDGVELELKKGHLFFDGVGWNPDDNKFHKWTVGTEKK